MARSLLPLIASLLAVFNAQAQVTKDPLPTQLVCHPSDNLTANISYEASGALLGAGVYATSGTHECSVQSQGVGVAQPDGSVRFAWTDEVEGNKRYQAIVKRVGNEGYTLALQPAGCGTIALPAAIALSTQGKACKARVDRDAAFVLFWRQLREAIARRDGELLQRLSLPQLEFSPDSGTVKAPASVIRNAATCIPGIVTTESGTDIGKMLKAIDTPQLDKPPLSRVADNRVSTGAFEARWTAQGWRLSWFNTSPAVFSTCKPG